MISKPLLRKAILYCMMVISPLLTYTQTCSSPAIIACGNITSTPMLAGDGSPDFPTNFMAGCYANGGIGGGEAFFKLIAAETGYYQVQSIAGSSSVIDYYVKPGNMDACSNLDWACIGSGSGNAYIGGFQLSAGDSIVLLANKRSPSGDISLSFEMYCPVVSGCNAPSPLTCDQTVTVNIPAGIGHPDFPLDLVSGCGSTIGIGGREVFYSFTATESGIYFFEKLNSATPSSIEYAYKPAYLDICSSDDWICISYGTSYGYGGAIDLHAGESIWIIANAAAITTSSQQIVMHCVADYACENIPNISCGVPVTFTMAEGPGDPGLPAYVGGSCNGITYNYEGGDESLFSFTASSSGVFTIDLMSTNSNIDFLLKPFQQNPCDYDGWNCIGGGILGSIATFQLTAGESVWLLANLRSSVNNNLNVTFQINCAVPSPCENYTDIVAGVPYTFNSAGGYGLPEFPNGITSSLCNNADGIGGPEELYRLVAPEYGTYQIQVIDKNTSYYVGYHYASYNEDPCDPTDYNCLGYRNNNGHVNALVLDPGEVVYILVNAEAINPLYQVFRINYIPFACNDVTEVNCGEAIAFQLPAGYGNEDVAVPMSDPENCSIDNDPGSERMYHFAIPETGNYQIRVIEVGFSDYADLVFVYKYDAPGVNQCSPTNWNCYGDSFGEIVVGMEHFNAGDEIYLLVQAQVLYALNCLFVIECAQPDPCEEIVQISCGNVIEFDPHQNFGVDTYSTYPNECSFASYGDEQIYMLAAPAAGDYSVEVIQYSGSASIQYSYMLAPSDPCSPPNSTDVWICLGSSDVGTEEWTISLADGDTLYLMLNVQYTSAPLHKFRINCPANDALVIDANIYLPYCQNNLADIYAGVSGGDGNYIYDWEDLPGTDEPSSRSVLPGLYHVTVTDGAGHTGEADYFVEDALYPMYAAANIVQPSVPGALDGAIYIDADNYLTESFDYLWDNGSTNNSLTSIGEGEYCVHVIFTYHNCDVEFCFNVEAAYTDTTSVVFTGTTNDAGCFDSASGSIELIIESGIAPFNVDWFDITGSNDVVNRTNLHAGIYQVTITGANGMQTSAQYTIGQQSEIILEINSTMVSQPGADNGEITIIAEGGAGGYTFDWENIPGTEDPAAQSNLSPGNYCATATDANGCTSQSICTTIVEVIAYFLDMTGTVIPTTCPQSADGSIVVQVIKGAPSYSFDWADLPDNLDNGTRTNLAEGLYTVTVSDAYGVSETQSFYVPTPETVDVIAQVNNVSLPGLSDGSIVLDISGGTLPLSLDWIDLDPEAETQDRTELLPGEYCISISDGNACVSEFCFVIQTDDPEPLVLAAEVNELICPGDSDASISLNIALGLPPYSIDWTDTPESDESSIRTNLVAGTYEAIISDAWGQLDSIEIIIPEPSPIIITALIIPAYGLGLNNGNIQLTIPWSNGENIIDWLDIPGNNDPGTLTELSAGNFCCTVTNLDGCITDSCFTIEDLGVGAINIQNTTTDLTCFGINSGSIDITISGGVAPYSYEWMDVSGATDPEDRINLGAGSYSLLVTDYYGISANGSFALTSPTEINVNSTVVNSSSATSNDGTITLDVSGGTPPYQFDWLDMIGTDNDQNRIELGPDQYCCTITDSNECAANVCETVDFESGVIDLTKHDLVVIPNPFDHSFILKIPAGMDVHFLRILDLQGRLIMHVENSFLNIAPEMSSGTYLLEVGLSSGIKRIKLVKS